MEWIKVASDTQRLAGWETAVNALGSHPGRWLFGWGPETFPLVYQLHRTPEMAQRFSGTADHAHNIVLELLVTTGLVGFTAVACLLYHLWERSDNVGRATILGALLFSMVEPVPFQAWALMLFIVGARYCGDLTWGVIEYNFKGPALRALTIAFLLVSASLWWSDMAAYRSGQALAAGDQLTAIQLASAAARFNPASIEAAKAQVFSGDGNVFERGRLFHPHHLDLAQLGVAVALAQGRKDVAVLFAKRAAKADPSNRAITDQTAAFVEAYGAR